MIRISQIKIPLEKKANKDLIKQKVVKELRVKEKDILQLDIVKESIDARGEDVKLIYTVDVKVKNENKVRLKKSHQKVSKKEYFLPESGSEEMTNRPVVIGFGPAGMFAGLQLAQKGYNPIILEQGEEVDKRSETVEKFWNEGILNNRSNVQFGEGGAGTFSDGKLMTRVKDPRIGEVFKEFVSCGAKEEILYKNKPHIGTDILKIVVKNIREKINSLGGEVRFDTKVQDLIIEENQIKGLKIEGQEDINTSVVVLAIGHSARDMFETLNKHEVKMESKPFAIGLRIEHLQEEINKSQYKKHYNNKNLGAAEYKLTYKSSTGRGVYTFCMCPGGYVVASASEEEHLVVNGMSYNARAGENSNSALIVTVKPEDYKDEGPLSGVAFQREIERKAFDVGGKDYTAPCQRIGDFLGIEYEEDNKIEGTYRPALKYTNFEDILPEYIIESLKEAIIHMDKKLKGFANPNALLTGVETRTSSPVRIIRDEEELESINIKGLYPCGEGAGYAGGITSSAVDCVTVAEKIIMRYAL
jgi:uncharacterized FAD-dependent dehydrogenase